MPVIFGVAGGSGSGKTLATEIAIAQIGPEKASLLHMDDYYIHPDVMLEKSNGMSNWDSPKALNWDAFRADLQSLSEGVSVTPPYNSEMFEQESGNPVTKGAPILPRGIIIVEGMYVLLLPEIRKQFRATAFIEVSHKERFRRRRRNIMTDEYVAKIHIPMHEEYVNPTMAFADLVIAAENSSPDAIATALVDLIHSRL